MIDHFHFWVNYPWCVGQCAVSGTRSPAWGNTAWKTTPSALPNVSVNQSGVKWFRMHIDTRMNLIPGSRRSFIKVWTLLMISVKHEPTAQGFWRSQGHNVSSYKTTFNWSLRNRTDRVQCSGLYFTSDHNLASEDCQAGHLIHNGAYQQDHCFLVTQPNAGL